MLSVNEEFPVGTIHRIALIVSLPFVHTARHYCLLEVLVRYLVLLAMQRGRLFEDLAGKFVKLKFLEKVNVVTGFL